MTATFNDLLAQQIAAAVASAGLQILAETAGPGFAGVPVKRFTLASLATAPEARRSLDLELSDTFDLNVPENAQAVAIYLAETARRLRCPRPNTLLTLTGIPLGWSGFEWPFHESTAGADTSLVHGQIRLEDGDQSTLHAAEHQPLHAKISAAMTVTFRDVVRTPEQPFAESFVLNAVRKTLDQGQIELVKSGNRQPVPVTTRYYSAKQQKFVFNDTTEPERRRFLATKTFWLSGVLGASAVGFTPVWLLDPRDAQYLNTTVAELKASVDALVGEGLIALDAGDAEFATPTATLVARQPDYRAELAAAIQFIKPTFNESMRAGQTNM